MRDGLAAPAALADEELGPRHEAVDQVGGVTRVIAVAGAIAWIGLGPRIAALDVSDEANPRIVGRGPSLDAVVVDLALDRGLLVAATGGPTLHVLDVSDVGAPQRIGGIVLDGLVDDVVMGEGFAYVRVVPVDFDDRDRSGRVAVVDLADPSAPALVTSDLLGEDGARVVDIARSRSALAVSTVPDLANPVSPTLRILSLDDPRAPRHVASLKHGAWLRLGTGAWSAGGPVSGAGPAGSPFVLGIGDGHAVVDLRDPARPQMVETGPAVGSRWPHARITADARGAVFVLEPGAFGGMRIGRPPDAATGGGVASDLFLPDAMAGGFAALGTRLLVSGIGGRLRVVDALRTSEETIGLLDGPGSVTDVAVDTAEDGPVRLFATSTQGGLSVLDPAREFGPSQPGSSPTGPALLGHVFDTSYRCDLRVTALVAVAGNCGESDVLTSDYDLFDVTDPAAPRLARRLKQFSMGHAIGLAGRWLVTTDRIGVDREEWVVQDVENPDAPVELVRYAADGELYDVALDGDAPARLLFARYDGAAGLQERPLPVELELFDLADPTAPRRLAVQRVSDTGGYALGHPLVDLAGRYAALSLPIGVGRNDVRFRIRIVDLEDEAAPRVRGMLDMPGVPSGLWFAHGHLLVDVACQRVTDRCGILLIDIDDPDAPRVIGHLPAREGVTRDGVAVDAKGRVFVADGAGGIDVYRPFGEEPDRAGTASPTPGATPTVGATRRATATEGATPMVTPGPTATPGPTTDATPTLVSTPTMRATPTSIATLPATATPQVPATPAASASPTALEERAWLPWTSAP